MTSVRHPVFEKAATYNDAPAAVDALRLESTNLLDPKHRAEMGQFLTPGPIAAFIAGMFDCRKTEIRILDPGAGTGVLGASLVVALCRRTDDRPSSISLTAVELDPLLAGYLRKTLEFCRISCEEVGISFEGRVVEGDFLEAGANALAGGLFSTEELGPFNCAILNPPYRKIRTDSRERSLLRSIGLETTNLYAGFVAVAARLLAPDGEMVAITPRSFCNGPYFEPFRRYFLKEMRFRRVHVFDARDTAFSDDKVLQENVVFHAVKRAKEKSPVVVSASAGPDDKPRFRMVGHDELVRGRDAVIHLVPEEDGAAAGERIGQLGGTLSDLGLTVSTGRVVDFRARALLRPHPEENTVPLIYPCHFKNGFVEWPNGQSRKPNALVLGPMAEDLVVPSGHYVLTKRFSSKEEKRRIVAAVYDPTRVPPSVVGFENHLNYYHSQGAGLSEELAKGIAAYLNSTLVDTYFRQFSGHTQVNATDLRSLPYPPRSALVALGRRIGTFFPAQAELDSLVDEVLFHG